MPDVSDVERKQRRLPRGRLSWLLRLLTGCRSSSISKAEVVATNATITQRLHALLATGVVPGVWRDFVPSRLCAVFVLGEAEQRMRKVEIGSAALAWCSMHQRAVQMTQVCALWAEWLTSDLGQVSGALGLTLQELR